MTNVVEKPLDAKRAESVKPAAPAKDQSVRPANKPARNALATPNPRHAAPSAIPAATRGITLQKTSRRLDPIQPRRGPVRLAPKPARTRDMPPSPPFCPAISCCVGFLLAAPKALCATCPTLVMKTEVRDRAARIYWIMSSEWPVTVKAPS